MSASIFDSNTSPLPPVSGGSGGLTRAVAGDAVAGETIAGMAGVVSIGGAVRTKSTAPLALLRADDGVPLPTPSSAVYGEATFGQAVFTSPITSGAIYGRATYGQARYGRVVVAKIGGVTRNDHAAPLAITRAAGPDISQ